jgi:hypothetical protein
MTRKWFQIHHSTAIVLMFLAGLLGYLNIVGWGGHVDEWITKSERLTGLSLGFPIKCALLGRRVHFLGETSSDVFYVRWDEVAIDAGIAMGLLFLTATLMERRLREAPKP